eukprot:2803808-Rhodomonas_salina.4
MQTPHPKQSSPWYRSSLFATPALRLARYSRSVCGTRSLGTDVAYGTTRSHRQVGYTLPGTHQIGLRCYQASGYRPQSRAADIGYTRRAQSTGNEGQCTLCSARYWYKNGSIFIGLSVSGGAGTGMLLVGRAYAGTDHGYATTRTFLSPCTTTKSTTPQVRPVSCYAPATHCRILTFRIRRREERKAHGAPVPPSLQGSVLRVC